MVVDRGPGDNEPCPRCNGTEFDEWDCGPDTYEDDISYTSWKCAECGLWWDGWTDRWLIDVDSWEEAKDAEEYPWRWVRTAIKTGV